MKKIFLIGLQMLLLTPVLVLAQSDFNGTWRVDINKAQLPEKPEVYLLQNGMFHCKSCVPPVDVKADGTDQKVTGHPYYDTVNIKVVDDRTVERTDKKDGKTVVTSKQMVSPDGKTETVEFSDSSTGNGTPVTGRGEATRIEDAPAGAHAISGSWRPTKLEDMSENGLMWTDKIEDGTLTMTTPTGITYTAKLDGTEAPYKGDPGIDRVSVKRLDDNTIEETDKLNGKVVGVFRMTLAPGGKTMTAVYDDKLRGTTSQFVAEKQ